ncbi:MAG: hypothetical protein AABX84_01215, partial [Nanoarchaeota archaeon]
MNDWLTEFVDYSSYGECDPKLMYWIGVSTIAGALRRKVWFDQIQFQWSPNFYIVIVGRAGAVKKSTSLDLGKKLLEEIEGINFGPDMCTWQMLIQEIARCKETVEIKGTPFDMSCMTLNLSELGTLM